MTAWPRQAECCGAGAPATLRILIFAVCSVAPYYGVGGSVSAGTVRVSGRCAVPPCHMPILRQLCGISALGGRGLLLVTTHRRRLQLRRLITEATDSSHRLLELVMERGYASSRGTNVSSSHMFELASCERSTAGQDSALESEPYTPRVSLRRRIFTHATKGTWWFTFRRGVAMKGSSQLAIVPEVGNTPRCARRGAWEECCRRMTRRFVGSIGVVNVLGHLTSRYGSHLDG